MLHLQLNDTAALFSAWMQRCYQVGQPTCVSAVLAVLTVVTHGLLGLHMQRGSGNFWLCSESTQIPQSNSVASSFPGKAAIAL